MEYVFGTQKDLEVLKTKGSAHTDLTDYHEIEQVYPDQTITDRFRVVRKLDSQEDDEGNCYDWYEIDRHYRVVDKTGPVLEQVNAVNATAGIAFVTMTEKGEIDGVTAGEHADIFFEWEPEADYAVGDVRTYEEKLYRCKAVCEQCETTPDEDSEHWELFADPKEEWPAWSKPRGVNDAYTLGDKVSHKGHHWTCTEVNGSGKCPWEPGKKGWTQADE